MRRSIGLAFLFLFSLGILSAQDQDISSSETIGSDNLDRLEVLASWQGTDNRFVTASFNADSSLLALVLNDGLIRLLDFPSLDPQSTLAGVSFEATQVKFNRDNSRLMVSDFYGNYAFWDVGTGEVIREYTLDSDQIWEEVDDDLRLLVTLNKNGAVIVREITSESEILSVEQADSLPYPRISPDGSLLLTVSAGGFSVWDISAGIIAYQFDKPENTELSGFGFSPDGHLIWANWRDWQYGRDVSENRSIVVFWDTADGSESAMLNGGGSHFRMYFSKSSQFVATAGENDQLQDTIWVWDVEKRKLLGQAGVPTGGGVAGFNPDGSLLAVASGTSTRLQFWDANEPEIRVIAAIDIGSGTFTPPTFSADGRYLLTVGADIRVWGIPLD
ncbi:MAG: WD40 repeat domain-containing protein [Anaerolineae bacterium]|nr:WD40 repeat domain-containing protein [Anaerolineae bacterium]